MKKNFMRTIRIVCSLTMCIALAGCGSSTTERIRADFNGHEYKFIDEDMTWKDARSACVALGGHLVTITSAEEEDFIESQFGSLCKNGGPWIGAYSNGAYGGDKDDWRWVTGEEWSYSNWEEGEPNNTSGSEWFASLRASMTWNDLNNVDSSDSQRGYICEFDDLQDIPSEEVSQDSEQQEESQQQEEEQKSEEAADESTAEMLTEGDPEEEEEPQGEDPSIIDIGKGKYRICSRSREVYIEYPYNYYASAEGDALFAYDGDGAYILARNITAEAMEYGGDMKAFCKAKADEQLKKDFKMLFGSQTGMDGVKHKGGDGKNLVCETRANIWNGSYDMGCVSHVRTSKGENGTYLILTTCFWKYNNKTSANHTNQFTTGSYHGN